MQIDSFLIRGADGLTFTVYRLGDGSLLLHTGGVHVAFGFKTDSGMRGHLSKRQIVCIVHDEAKSALALKGHVKFIADDGIERLIRDRFEGLELENALADLERAKLGCAGVSEAAPSVVESPASTDSPIRSFDLPPKDKEEADDDHHVVLPPVAAAPPPPLMPPPRPLPDDHIVPVLKLPTHDEWWLDEEYRVGKKYALEAFDHSPMLCLQLADYKAYWMSDDREDGDALSEETVDKRVQRALLFLGFLSIIGAVSDLKSLTLNAVLNHSAVVAYNTWCARARDMQSANMAENLSCFISVVKFLLRSDANASLNKFSGCELVLRYRSMRNKLQSKALLVKKTEADLSDSGKWLSWPLFMEAIDELQREFDELVANSEDRPTPEKARLSHDVILLRIYSVSPGRSGEVRHLEFLNFGDICDQKGKSTVSKWIMDQKRNIVTKRDGSCWEIYIANSKTSKHVGVDSIAVQEELFPELDRCLTQYLVEPGYRRELLDQTEETEHGFLFMNHSGKGPFGGSQFSRYLSDLIFRLTGVKATSNILRSSFVTNLMGQNPNDALKASAAALLRHSTRAQTEVYDRRSVSERKNLAQQFISRKRVERDELEVKHEMALLLSESDRPTQRSKTAALAVEFSAGMLVVVPYVDSQTGERAFWFAKVLRATPVEVTLIELKPAKESGRYKADLKSTWTEPLSAVHLVDAEYDADANVCYLLIPVAEILELLE